MVICLTILVEILKRKGKNHILPIWTPLLDEFLNIDINLEKHGMIPVLLYKNRLE